MAKIKKSKGLSAVEEKILFRKLRVAKPDTRSIITNQILNANMGLVCNIAKKYKSRRLDLDDLISLGCAGLLEAVQKFDYSKGCRFSTYATWWIYQHIYRGLSYNEPEFLIPAYMGELVHKVLKEQESYFSKYGHAPSMEYLSRKFNTSTFNIGIAIQSTQVALSLDKELKDVESGNLGDFIRDMSLESEDDIVTRLDKEDVLDKCLASLPEREKYVIIHRYGLEGNVPKTLGELGELLGNITRERVRQIELNALKRLRNPIRASKLATLIEE